MIAKNGDPDLSHKWERIDWNQKLFYSVIYKVINKEECDYFVLRGYFGYDYFLRVETKKYNYVMNLTYINLRTVQF